MYAIGVIKLAEEERRMPEDIKIPRLQPPYAFPNTPGKNDYSFRNSTNSGDQGAFYYFTVMGDKYNLLLNS